MPKSAMMAVVNQKLVYQIDCHGCYISFHSDDLNWQLINHIYQVLPSCPMLCM